MATVVFLSWKGMTREDDADQSGCRPGMGRLSVVVAEADQISENAALAAIFPRKYWDEKEPKLRYKFTRQEYEKLKHLGVKYIAESISGKKRLKPNKLTDQLRCDLIRKFPTTTFPIARGVKDLPVAVQWLDDLYGFYQLGMELEAEKRAPKVRISW